MLYLEDYLEMIEHLPQELRDRFTEMRELDLSVQNSMDSLEKKTRAFFMQCKRGELQNGAAELEYQNLRKEYYKVLEDADEKVAIATQIHELVERYLRRLDSELFKFKCELEADNNGITEILEKRSLELDGCSASSMIGIGQKENRYFGSLTSNNYGVSIGSMGMVGGLSSSQLKDNRYRPKPEKRRNSSNASLSGSVEKRQTLGNNIVTSTPATPVTVVRPLTPNLGVAHHSVIAPAATTASSVAYNLQHMGGAGNAIAAAASQAIVATQQMQQGRRTASLKASYEAIHGAASGSGSHDFWINRDLSGTGPVTSTIQSGDRDNGSTIPGQQHSRKQKKKLSSNLTHQAVSITSSISLPSSSSPLSSHADSTSSSVEILPTSSSGSVGITIIGVTPIASGGTLSTANTSANRNVVSTAVSVAATPVTSDSGLVVEQTAEGEWAYDPNEPRYCTCNQVSYGDMVACDNDACPYEWFHYPCVGITQPPKGKWYCPKCTASMRRRGNRKN